MVSLPSTVLLMARITMSGTNKLIALLRRPGYVRLYQEKKDAMREVMKREETTSIDITQDLFCILHTLVDCWPIVNDAGPTSVNISTMCYGCYEGIH